MKTKIFYLIGLDGHGLMKYVRRQNVSCNNKTLRFTIYPVGLLHVCYYWSGIELAKRYC